MSRLPPRRAHLRAFFAATLVKAGNGSEPCFVRRCAGLPGSFQLPPRRNVAARYAADVEEARVLRDVIR